MNLKLAAGLTALVAFAALTAGAAIQHGRIKALSLKVEGYQACEAAVAGKPKAQPAAKVCSAAIARADAVADRALACDAAIGNGDLYGIEHSCSGPVKGLEARAGIAERMAAGLADELTAERKGRAAALAAAETRGQLSSERKARAAAAVEAAPRDADGLAVHDADRVCARWGCPGDARR